ncbi:hypothetical protein VTL71DRAFT_3533 [Oculimacula yallundae]|uniref:TauD/TfdA-like domain-containing protein n=1 Tax=Oculimacula yallundae TaxID=86028 RepID=A0ABR4C7G6_9HELO
MAQSTSDAFWQPLKASYQKHYKLIEDDSNSEIPFPLILSPAEKSLDQVLQAVSKLGAKPADGDKPSELRTLMDANGGVINFKNMPLHTADDFSKFVTALAGTGSHGLVPHKDFGGQVLRREHAKHVVATNEGPSTDIITWHNEYSVSPSHPHYVIFFCEKSAPVGGETPVTSSLASYDRLKKVCPEYLEQSAKKGYAYKVYHTAVQTRGLVGGNGVFSPTAFGPVDENLPVELQRRAVDDRIEELMKMGGWSRETVDDPSLPPWQRRGFDWKWTENGDCDITHRVPGIRIHPTRNMPSYFNAMANRWAYANKYNTWKPPHIAVKEDGKEQTFWPPLFAGTEEDEVIPKQWMDKADEIQNELSSNVAWEAGDVMVIDNFAVQHARLPWTGDRKVLASFWDEPGLHAAPMKWE